MMLIRCRRRIVDPSAAPKLSFHQSRFVRPMHYQLRTATLGDEPALRELIARSIRALGAGDYAPAQIEAALREAFGVDTTLIRDGTYFVAATVAGQLIGCGGWSYRRTLFGNDARTGRDASPLDPKTDAAKIRAFFIDPAHARQGIGRAVLQRCEAEAMRAGFSRFEMMATLPGVRLYESCGYVAGSPTDYPLGGGLSIRFVPMSKRAAEPVTER
jgi:GNAT superfamily N-acetyltransferase